MPIYNPLETHETDEDYSPHSLLPAPEPKTYAPPIDYFYNNVAKHLIKDTVRIMGNGLGIDLDKVEQLESELDTQLERVTTELASNPIIKTFQKLQHKKLVAEYKKDRASHLRKPLSFLKPFNYKDMVHRSYFMNIYAQRQNITQPTELLPTGIPKWPANLVKKLSNTYPILRSLLDGTLSPTHTIAKGAMTKLANDKATMYNQKYLEAIEFPNVDIPSFNPGSSKQKQELFDYLDIESEVTSKDTGLPSWNRDQIERINKETIDKDIQHLTQCFIDHSFSAIVRDNFIAAFYRFTNNDRLYGNYKLIGAKSGRYTSNKPNMLNMPSTKSIFSKPIKKCFVPQPGFLIATADYSALEDRVIASLSRDENKCNIFLQNLDGHCLNAYGYFKSRVAAEMPLTNDTVTDVKEFFRLVETNSVLKEIRQEGKPATFGLSYGAYPKKVAATLKIPLADATQIFTSYHNELYPGITDYRENYVLPTTKENGYIHLGMGFYIHSEDPDKDIRTLNNATCQFWSILTALTINEMHRRIDEANLENDIIVTSTIYDSIYFEVRDKPETIKWLNDNLIPIMTTDFMENQIIKNTADLEIGRNWADLHIIKNNATLEDIKAARKAL